VNGTSLPLDGYGTQTANVTCNSYAKVYGQADPAFGFTTNVVVPAWTVAPICGVTAEEGSGSYTIAVTNQASVAATGFTSFTFTSGTLVVSVATPVLTLSCPEVLYDGSSHGCTGTANGVNGETGIQGSFSFSYTGTGITTYGPSATAPTNAGSYSVVGTFTSINTNYASGGTAAGALKIDAPPPPPVVTAPRAIPYMTSLFAGTANQNSANNPYAVGQACPSGNGKTAVDAYGDGCLATEAVLYTPWAVVFDSAGNAYIADTNAASYAYVRKVDAVTGIISLFAGGLSATVSPSPCSGYTSGAVTGADPAVTGLAFASVTAGDGCPAVDPNTGAPYTYFKGIRDLAIDANYLYIADSSNSKIRKVSLSNSPLPYHYYAHEVEPVAGEGGSGWSQDGSPNTVQIKNPYAVAVDTAGNVFFADQSGDAIRRVTPTTYSLVGGVVTPSVGAITTILNCAASGNTCSVQSNGEVCPSGSPAGASKNITAYNITGLVFDSNGNLYVSEKSCYSVYQIANNGVNPIDGTTAVTTLMGNGVSGVYSGGTWMPAYTGGAQSSTRGVVSAGGLNLYIVNAGNVWFYNAGDTAGGATNGWLEEIWNSSGYTGTGCTGSVGTTTYYGCPAPNSSFNASSQGAKGSIDAYGNLYIADGNDSLILKAASGLDFAGTAPQVQVLEGHSLTNAVLLHGTGVSDSYISTSPLTVFNPVGLLSYPFGGPFTSDCNTDGNGTDGATDCTYSLTYAPTAIGLQTGTLTADATSLPLDGYGTNSVSVACLSYAKTYGQADPSFGFATSATIPPITSWTVAPVCAVEGEAGAGTYPIVVTNQSSVAAEGVASFTFSAGTLTVTGTAVAPTLTLSCPAVTYDGNAHACSGTATGVGGVTVTGTWSFSPASETNAGSYTVTGTFTSTNPNYTSGGTASGTLVINLAAPTLSATCDDVIYDGNPHTCTGSATGVTGATVAGSFSFVPGSEINAGTYAETGTFTSTDPNYVSGGTASDTLEIDRAPQTPSVSCPHTALTYNGQAYGCSVSGIGGCGSGTVTNVPGGIVTFGCNGDANHQPFTGQSQIVIVPATPVVGVTCTTVPYDGNPHSCTGAATGVGGASVAGSFSFAPGSESNAGSYAETGTFTSTNNNYVSGGTASGTLLIAMANQAPAVSCPGPLTYDGNAHSCTITGGFGACTSPSVTNVPGSTTLALSCAGDANHNAWSSTGAITINPATPALALTCAGVTYDGNPHSCSGSATGIGGATVAGSFTFSPASETNAGNYPVTALFASSDSNYAGGSASGSLVIAVANQSPAVSCPGPLTYDGAAHSCTITGGFGACISPSVTNVPGSSAIALSCTGDANHHIWVGTGSITINPATPILALTCAGVTYDGNPHSCTGSATGIGGATVAGSFSVSPASQTNAGSYPVTALFASSDSNYASGSATGSLVIAAANQSPSVFCPGPLTYDGAAHSCTITGGIGACSSALVTNVPGSTTLALSCAGDANHNAWAATGTIIINPASPALTVTCPEVTYDGNPHLCTASAMGLGGATVAGVFAFNPVSETAAGSYPVTVIFASSDSNYVSGGTAQGTLIIDKVNQSPSVSCPGPLTYDGNAHSCTITSGIGTCTSASVTTVPGSTTLALSCAGDANHSSWSSTGSIVINPATPVLNLSCAPVTYDGNPHACTGTATGIGGVTVAGSFGFSPASETAAGSYPLTGAYTSSDPNYVSGGTVAGTLIISPATPALGATCAGGRYNGTAYSCTGTATGVGGAVVTGSFVFNPGSETNVGSYPETGTFTSTNSNYASGGTATGTLVITAATPTLTLTCTAVTANGSPQACLPGGSATGIGGVTVAGSWSYTYNGSATLPSAAATYAVVGTFTSNNSDYASGNTATGAFVINSGQSVGVVLSCPTVTYDGTVHGCTIMSTTPAGASCGGLVPETSAGSYAESVICNATGYAAGSASGILVITPVTVTPTVTVADKAYDGTTTGAVSACTLTVVIGSDDVTCSYSGATATFADANPGTGKTVTVTGLSLAGATAGNYLLSTTTATVTGNITIAFGNVSMDSSSQQSITLTNPAITPLNILSFSISNQVFSLNNVPKLPVVLSPNGTMSFDLIFAPLGVIASTGTLTIATDAPTSPITVALSGSGAAPTLPPAVAITIATDQTTTTATTYHRGQAVKFSGLLTAAGGVGIAGVPVNVSVAVNGTVRTLTNNTDDTGAYNIVFLPTASDGGDYTATAIAASGGVAVSANTSFRILGLLLDPNSISQNLLINGTATVPFTMQNLGDAPLNSLNYSVTVTPLGGLTATLSQQVATLAPGSSVPLSLDLTAPTGNPPSGPVSVVINVSGTDATSSLVEPGSAMAIVTLQQPVSTPVLTPASATVGATPGQSYISTFSVANTGNIAMNSATVTLQNPGAISWVALGDGNLGNIAPGASAQFQFQVAPPAGTATGSYSVPFTINGGSTPLQGSLTITVTPVTVGTAAFVVSDDIGLQVPGATITLYQLVNGSSGSGSSSQGASREVSQMAMAGSSSSSGSSGLTNGVTFGGTTNASGQATISGVTGGTYEYVITAPTHDPLTGSVTVTPGATTDSSALLSYDVVSLAFIVVPTMITDQYNVTLSLTYDTTLPKPALQVLPYQQNLSFFQEDAPNGRFPCSLSVTNTHPTASVSNLTVDATQLDANLPANQQLLVFFANNSQTYPLGSLAGKATVVVPCYATIGSDSVSSHLAGNIVVSANYEYSVNGQALEGTTKTNEPVYYTQPNQLGYSPISFTYDMTKPGAPVLTYNGNSFRYNITDNSTDNKAFAFLQPFSGYNLAVITDTQGGIAASDVISNNLNSAYWYTDTNKQSLSGQGDSTTYDISTLFNGLTLQQALASQLAINQAQVLYNPNYVAVEGDWAGSTSPSSYLIPIEITEVTNESVVIGGGGGGWGGFSPMSFPQQNGQMVLNIDQTIKLERQAFNAELAIDAQVPLSNTKATLQILDSSGHDASANFTVIVTGGAPATTGGTVPALIPYPVSWQIIPSAGAGGTLPQGTVYQVQATLNYVANGKPGVVSTQSLPITVMPGPQLTVAYTAPFVVMNGKNAYIRVSVTNTGYGTAHNLSIASVQPTIMETIPAPGSNPPIVDFSLTGSSNTAGAGGYIPGQLTINFGDVAAGATVSGYWTLQTTRKGFIIDFTSTFSASDYMGQVLDPLVLPPKVTLIPAIGGTVWDNSGDPLANMSVTVSQNGVVQGTDITDAFGDYYIPTLAAGNYFEQVIAPAGQVRYTDNITVMSDQATDFINFGTPPAPAIYATLAIVCNSAGATGGPQPCTPGGAATGTNGVAVAGTWSYTYAGINGTSYPFSATPPSAVGTYNVVGTFASSNSNYYGGTVSTTMTILPSSLLGANTIISYTPLYPLYGQPLIVTATVAPQSGAGTTPTGSVSFVVVDPELSSTPMTEPLVNGVATLTVNNLIVGMYTITGTYSGDNAYIMSADTVFPVVGQAFPTIYSKCYPALYDGNPHGCSPQIVGVTGEPLSGVCTTTYTDSSQNISSIAPSGAGTYQVSILCIAGDLSDYQPNTATAELNIVAPMPLMAIDPASLNIPQWAPPAGLANVVVPQGVATDTGGDLYIVDSANAAVEEVLAGGLDGSTPDVVISQGLVKPQAVTTDPFGDIYVVDAGNGTIQLVNGPGLIPVADGLNAPMGIVADADGNLYVSDTGNNEVDLVDTFSGNTLVIAGGGTPCAAATDAAGDGCPATQAILNGPAGLAIDANGNLYIADAGNNVIREVNVTTGMIRTVAGMVGQAGSSGDGGLAIAAMLNNPLNLVVDSANRLYIVDAGNNAVRLVDAGGGIQTWAGSLGTAGSGGADLESMTKLQLSSPAGIALDPSGNIYLADTGNMRTIEINRESVTYDFDMVHIGQTSQPQTFTVTNIGSAPLTFNSGTPDLYGNSAWETEGAPGEFVLGGLGACQNGGVLAVAGSCKMNVAYAPNDNANNQNPAVANSEDFDDIVFSSNASNNGDYIAITVQGDPFAPGPPTVSVICAEVAYDGSAHFCTGTATGTGGAAVSGSWSFDPATETAAGSYLVTGTFTSSDPNYSGGTATATLIIDPANQSPSVSCPGPLTYDGAAHSCAITGGIGACTSASVTNVPGSSTLALSCAGDANHNAWSGTGSITINPATPALSVTCTEVTYDGNPHTCTGSATGIGGAQVAGSFAFSPAGETAAGSYPVTGTFTTGDTNYVSGGTATATLIVDAATQSPSVSCPGPLTYDGAAHSCAITGGIGACTSASVTNVPGSTTLALSCAGDGNHNAWSSTGAITINPATSALTLTCTESTYDGNPHSCTGTATGIGGATVAGSFGFNPASETAAGSYPVTGTFTSSDTNYVSGGTATATLTIDAANQSPTVSCPGPLTYDGAAHSCATGGIGACTSASVTNVPGSTTLALSCAGDANHNPWSGTGSITINPATPALSVICAEAAYDGNPHSCTGTATGIGGATVAGSFGFTPASETAAGSYPVTGTFTSSDTNYVSGGTATATLVINAANQSPSVSCPGPLAYDGTAHSCTIASGSGTCTSASVTNVPGSTTLALSCAGDANHNPWSGTGSIAINPATPALSVICAEVAYDGNPHTCTGVATGIGGAAVSGSWSFTPATEAAAGSYPVTGTFVSGDTNYAGGTASGTLKVDAVTPTVTVTCPTVTYDGGAHLCTATATGVGGATVSGWFTFSPGGEIMVGSYPETATFTSNNANYTNASGSGTLVISGQPKLGLSPATAALSFGSQLLGTSAAAQYVSLTNNGSAPSLISGAKVNNGVFAISDEAGTCTTSMTLEPGRTCVIRLVFTPTSAGVVGGKLTITSADAPGGAYTVTLSGTGQAPAAALTLSTTSVTFPTAQTDGVASPAQYVLITSTGTAPLQVTGVTVAGANPGDFTVSNQAGTCWNPSNPPTVLAYHAECNLRVVFTPPAGATGLRTATLLIADNASGAPQLVTVSGTAISGAQLSVSATTLTFAATAVGAAAPAQYITLKSAGYQPVVISQVVLSSGDFDLSDQAGTCTTAATTSLVPGASCNIRVKFHPTATGGRTTTVVVNNNSANTPISVTLNGTGE